MNPPRVRWVWILRAWLPDARTQRSLHSSEVLCARTSEKYIHQVNNNIVSPWNFLHSTFQRVNAICSGQLRSWNSGDGITLCLLLWRRETNYYLIPSKSISSNKIEKFWFLQSHLWTFYYHFSNDRNVVHWVFITEPQYIYTISKEHYFVVIWTNLTFRSYFKYRLSPTKEDILF